MNGSGHSRRRRTQHAGRIQHHRGWAKRDQHRPLRSQGPGDVADNASLSYPYAIEHEGKLYVGYSNSGGRRGNHNSAELAVIPVRELSR